MFGLFPGFATGWRGSIGGQQASTQASRGSQFADPTWGAAQKSERVGNEVGNVIQFSANSWGRSFTFASTCYSPMAAGAEVHRTPPRELSPQIRECLSDRKKV